MVTAPTITTFIAGGSSVKGGFFLIFLLSLRVEATSFQNIQDFISTLNFSSAYNSHRVAQKVKIAVLDNGFSGYKDFIGKTLPSDTVYHSGTVASTTPEENHGLILAELLASLITNENKAKNIPFELHLYSTFGYTNFSEAVEDVIKNKMDVVLYAQVWEYGGNNDGTGFIDKLVSHATKAGILWVNAAGNFGQGTYNSPISIGGDDWVKLPGTNDSVHLRCSSPSGKKCFLRTVLSWNDFHDDVNLGTNKDLDLILTDDTLNIKATSALIQKEELTEPAPEGYSKYPREIIETQIDPGLYFLRVKVKSKNFSENKDSLRITVSGNDVELMHRDEDETVLSPADNSSVITVGASDSKMSSHSLKMEKPEIFAPSLLIVSDKEQYKGTSSAAAIVAAGAVIMKAYYNDLNKEKFLTMVRKEDNSSATLPIGEGLPMSVLHFNFTGESCFTPMQPSPVMMRLYGPILQSGGVFVETTAGVKVFTIWDPIMFAPNIRRIKPDDMLILSPQGFYLLPRAQQTMGLPNFHFEVLQTPRGQSICGLTKTLPNSFYMPSL